MMYLAPVMSSPDRHLQEKKPSMCYIIKSTLYCHKVYTLYWHKVYTLYCHKVYNVLS